MGSSFGARSLPDSKLKVNHQLHHKSKEQSYLPKRHSLATSQWRKGLAAQWKDDCWCPLEVSCVFTQVRSCSQQLQYFVGMGNDEFSISPSIRSEWQQRVGAGRRIFQNKLSHEQFQLIVLAKSQTHCSIPQLVHRSIDPLPHTPRLIILNDAQGHLSLLAQRPKGPLTGSTSHLLALEALQLARKAAIALRGLLLRFGPFEVASSQLGISTTGEPLVWINSSFERSDVQNPLPRGQQGQEKMVRQTVVLLKSLLPQDMQQQMASEIVSFSKLLEILEMKVEEQRLGLLSQKQRWKPLILAAHQVLSPQGRTTRIGQHKLEPPNNKPTNLANNIPKFVKNMKQEKHFFSKSPPIPRMDPSQRERKAGGRECRIEQQLALKKVRSLNGSPDAGKMTSTLKSTAISFNHSQGRLDQLLLSKNSSKGLSHPNTLEIPLIHSLSSTQLPSKHSIPEVEEETTYREVTFNNPPFRSGLLGSFCRGVSQSQQLHESMINVLEQDLSLQLQGGLEESVVIHKVAGTGTFDGRFLALYDEIGKVLF